MITQSELDRFERLYPMLYLSCHRSHAPRSDSKGYSERFIKVLQHISASPGITASELTRHLSVNKSSISATLKKLLQEKLIEKKKLSIAGKKGTGLYPSHKGKELLSFQRLFDTKKLTAVLATLTEIERSQVLESLELLATACQKGLKVSEKQN